MTLFGNEPERPVAPLLQLDDSVAGQLLGVGGVEDGESNPIEANEPIERRRPDVAGAVLEKRVDGVDGEAVLHRPRLVYPRVSARGSRRRRGAEDLPPRSR